MATHDRITVDPRVQHGKPVIKGTRVPVARIVESLAGGMSREQVQRDYGITEEDLSAAIEFESERWDAQIENDAKAGRLDRFAGDGL